MTQKGTRIRRRQARNSQKRKKLETYIKNREFKVLPQWKVRLLVDLLADMHAPIFLHIPKTGGTTVKGLCKRYNIETCKHNLGVLSRKRRRMVFCVVRNPVDRFESFLNYRLGQLNIRPDWPVRIAYRKKEMGLSKVLRRFKSPMITNLKPFRTLKNFVDVSNICFTIQEIPEAIAIMKCLDKVPKLGKANVSVKKRSPLNKASRDRIQRLFKKDMDIYEKWSRV